MDLRTVQKLVGDEWKRVEFMSLRLGDKFRMFESTGEPVLGLEDNYEWVATSNPFLDKDGKVWIIESDIN